MQELDARRRAAILRGHTPPPLPEESESQSLDSRQARGADGRGHGRKRRKLAGEDDTDMDIRLAKSATAPKDGGDEDVRLLRLRSTANDAPLTDHAGNIDLFPVNTKDMAEHTETEKERRNKREAQEKQYNMRLSDAGGRGGLSQPWYTRREPTHATGDAYDLSTYPGLEAVDVWGNEDPRRKEREQTRVATTDPFALMQQAQAQLRRSKEDKKRWAEERNQELRELRASQQHEDRSSKDHKRKKSGEPNCGDISSLSSKERTGKKGGHRHRDRDRGGDKVNHKSSHQRERRRSGSRTRERGQKDKYGRSSSR